MAYREACDRDVACGWDEDACGEGCGAEEEDGAFLVEPACLDLDHGEDALGDADVEDDHEDGGEAWLQDAGVRSYGAAEGPLDLDLVRYVALVLGQGGYKH